MHYDYQQEISFVRESVLGDSSLSLSYTMHSRCCGVSSIHVRRAAAANVVSNVKLHTPPSESGKGSEKNKN